jgi:hypothetical protein
MSKTADYFLELQEYVYDAMFHGAQTEGDVREYIREFHPSFNVIESALIGVFEDYVDQNWSNA